MSEKIKLAMVASSLSINGISSVIFNYAKLLDSDYFELTVLAGQPIAELYQQVAKCYNIRILDMPNRKKELPKYAMAFYKYLRKYRFDIVHVHGNSSSMAIELLAAKLAGVKIRIAHSHNTTCSFKAHKLLLPFFNRFYTDAFACGRKAGEWLFNDKKVYIMRNGFDVNRFRFNENIRKAIRNELQLEGKYVVGHIGRFNYQKNQEYLLDVFECIASQNENAVLLLIGAGDNEKQIQERITKSKYGNRMIMYGETTEPEKLYMAMDIMVFPSRYEGLPVTLLEAQISGLPCLISDAISKEVVFLNDAKMLSIGSAPSVWADEVVKSFYPIRKDRSLVFDEYSQHIKEYNIEHCVKELEQKYKTIYMRKA